MKHKLIYLIALLTLFCACKNKNKEKTSTQPDTEQRYNQEEDLDTIENFEDEIDEGFDFYIDSLGVDRSNEEDAPKIDIDNKYIPEYILADDVLLIRMDTLSPLADKAYFKAAKEKEPTGVAILYIYPEEKFSQYIPKINVLRSFGGGYSYSGFNMDPPSSHENFITIKNKLATYIFNPNKKPLVGLLISTVDSAPIFYEGDSQDLIETVKKHFKIKTKAELQTIIKSKVKIANEMLVDNNEKLFSRLFPKSDYKFDKKQTSRLNKYIIEYLLQLKKSFVLPYSPEIDEFKGKVKKVEIRFYNEANSIPDSTLIVLEYNKKKQLTYHSEKGKNKIERHFSYTADGMLDSVRCNYTDNSYRIYTYQDSVIAVQLPDYFEYFTEVPQRKVMRIIPSNALPLSIDKFYIDHIDMQFVFDTDENLISFDDGRVGNSFQNRQYKYKNKKLYQVKTRRAEDLVYTYHKDNIVVKTPTKTYIQALTYDKQGNILTATFDKRSGSFETIDKKYTYTYY